MLGAPVELGGWAGEGVGGAEGAWVVDRGEGVCAGGVGREGCGLWKLEVSVGRGKGRRRMRV